MMTPKSSKNKNNKKQPQQGKVIHKVKAWCGECFQFFESGPQSRICLDHLSKGFCNLVKCKKNSELTCIRRFPNTNSENRHTYCIDIESLSTFDENIKIQNVLGKRKDDDIVNLQSLSLKEDKIDELKNEHKLSNSLSFISKENNCNQSIMDRSSYNDKYNSKTYNKYDFFEEKDTNKPKIFIPNIIDSLELDNISLKTHIYNEKENNELKITQSNISETFSNMIIDNNNNKQKFTGEINEFKNDFISNKLLIKNDSNYHFSKSNTSDIFKYIDNKIQVNNDDYHENNIFGLCNKINKLEFNDDEEEILNKINQMKVSNEINKISKGLQTKSNSLVNQNINQSSTILCSSNTFYINNNEITDNLFNNFNSLCQSNFTKQILNKIKNAFKKKGLINAETIRLYIKKKDQWDLFISNLEETCSQVSGVALLLENLLEKKNN